MGTTPHPFLFADAFSSQPATVESAAPESTTAAPVHRALHGTERDHQPLAHADQADEHQEHVDGAGDQAPDNAEAPDLLASPVVAHHEGQPDRKAEVGK